MPYAFSAIPISGMILVFSLFVRIPIIGQTEVKSVGGKRESGNSRNSLKWRLSQPWRTPLKARNSMESERRLWLQTP
ncbi:hypothetical protein BJ742DRAFT_819183 [Cladochytrium replicatum]|nr:hypothetical protein BJ742DRAFT_819183 [Cladochytrium replicatum]